MTFVKDRSIVLTGRALQRNLLTSPGSREDRAEREARLKKRERYDVSNQAKKGLKEGAGDPARVLNKQEVLLGEVTLGRQTVIVELDKEKTLSLEKAIDGRLAEWNVLLLQKKDNGDGVLPGKREKPASTGLLHLTIGSAWRSHIEVASKRNPIVKE